jgi:hypothetical protein
MHAFIFIGYISIYYSFLQRFVCGSKITVLSITEKQLKLFNKKTAGYGFR